MSAARFYGTVSILVLIGSIFLSGCGGPRETLDVSRGEATVEFTIQWPTSRVIPEATQTIKVWVSGIGINTPILKLFRRPTDSRPSGTAVLTVPAGPQRLFCAAAFDASNNCIAFGNAAADLSPGERKTLVIDMQLTPSRPSAGDIRKLPGDVGWQYGVQVIPDPDNPLQAVAVLTIRTQNREDDLTLTSDKFVIDQIVRRDDTTVRVSPSEFSGGGNRRRNIDIAFVLDTTGSMGSEIAGVRDSVRNFASILADAGHDIRLGAITFGDEIRERLNFTNDVEQFKNFVARLDAYGGGDTPEIGLDAVLDAHERLSWRDGAEKYIIVITDATAHQRDDGTPFSRVTAQEVIESLRGRYVVHVVSSVHPGRSRASQQDDTVNSSYISPNLRSRTEPYDMKNLAPALGGIWIELPETGEFDLVALGITDIIRNTYTFKFPRALWFNSPNETVITIFVQYNDTTWIRFPIGAGAL
jgi:Mg-chelatase subunit ChlD